MPDPKDQAQPDDDLDLEEDDLFDDEIDDGEGQPDGSADDGAAAGDDKDDKKGWFIPGKYKTAEDAKRGIKKSERYIKRLEKKNKDLKTQRGSGQGQGQDQQPADKPKGITEQEFLADPVNVTTRIAEEAAAKAAAAAAASGTQANVNLLMDKAQRLYPDFDIVANENKLAAYAMKYSAEFRQKNGLKILSEAIEHFGGKRRSRPVHSDDPSTPSTHGKGGPKDPAEQIKEGIKNAQGYVDPLAGLHSK